MSSELGMADLASLEQQVARAQKRLQDVITDRSNPSTIHLHRRRLQRAQQQLEAAKAATLPDGAQSGRTNPP